LSQYCQPEVKRLSSPKIATLTAARMPPKTSTRRHGSARTAAMIARNAIAATIATRQFCFVQNAAESRAIASTVSRRRAGLTTPVVATRPPRAIAHAVWSVRPS
jgi:hypothetical protein